MSEVATDNNDYELTEQDILFVAAKTSGLSQVDALIETFTEDDEIQTWAAMRNDRDSKNREYAKLMLRKKARAVSNRRPIAVLTQHYQDRMVQMGMTALDTLEELMIEGKSEKVRADVAIEVARHNLGNPDKDQSRGVDTVVVVLGEPPKDIRNQADIHRNKQQMGVDIDYNQTLSDAHERRMAQFDSAIEAEVVDESGH